MVRLLASIVIALCLASCAGLAPASAPPVRVLYLSQSVGFVHETVRRPEGGLAPSETALQQMARDSGTFTVEFSQDARDISPARLAELDVLVFSTTGALPIDPATWAAITAWIDRGDGGFVGIHSATDTALNFEGGQAAYAAFVGGRFDGHPWMEGTPIRLANLEPAHPLAAMWPDGSDFAEEIYQYADFDPARVRVLQALDMGHGPLRRPYPVPVTWVREHGAGRVFYTNLGHTLSTWDDPRFRDQIVQAIRWTAHRTDAPATPNPTLQDHAALDAFRAAEGRPANAGPVPPGLAANIRALKDIHPERRAGDTSAWEASLARLRNRTQ